MRFTEINLFGVYVVPMSLMVVAWVATIGLRWFAARFGLAQHVLLAQRHQRRVAAQARRRLRVGMINPVLSAPNGRSREVLWRLPNHRAFVATAARITAVPMSNDSFRRYLAVRACSGEGQESTLSRPPGAGTKARRAPFPLSAPPPLDPGHHPVNLAAAAPGTAQPLAPIDNRRFGTYRAAISAGTGST